MWLDMCVNNHQMNNIVNWYTVIMSVGVMIKTDNKYDWQYGYLTLMSVVQ